MADPGYIFHQSNHLLLICTECQFDSINLVDGMARLTVTAMFSPASQSTTIALFGEPLQHIKLTLCLSTGSMVNQRHWNWPNIDPFA